MNAQEYFTPNQCLKLRELGFPQGQSKYLWHKDKHSGNYWYLYKRNKVDISSFGDSHGYSRWVSAIKLTNLNACHLLGEENE